MAVQAEATDNYLLRAQRYAVAVAAEEDEPFVARAIDFGGVVGVGGSPEEAEADLRAALADMIEHMEDLGQPVPEPLSSYSGTFSVRVPRSLHVALVQRAKAEGISINAEVTYLLTQALRDYSSGVSASPPLSERAASNAASALRT
ncbi:MAG: type II toxin-antitoxin system HicB family antitoxin [Armatimonadetes bacterium]|nr:type II toxin-antitoxin system HicB family antitoxin [Armatimonadota bacterium]